MDKIKIIEVLEGIDKKFVQNDVPIHARPILAVLEFARKFELSIPVVVSEFAHTEPDYPIENEYITIEIHDWYNDRYADLLKVDFTQGKTAVEVNGNVMIMKMPKIYGHMSVFWDPSRIGVTHSQGIKVGPSRPPLDINVIDIIVGLTPSLAKDVSSESAKKLVQWFIDVMDVYQYLLQPNGNQLLVQALFDLNNSVDSLVGTKPNYSQSKWASLQATEKILKSFIVKSGKKFSYTHKLIKLANEAGFCSEKEINLLNDIQCTANSRYGKEIISKQDALKAHKSTIRFIFWLLKK